MGKLRDRPAGLRDRGGKVVLSPHSRLLVTMRRKIISSGFFSLYRSRKNVESSIWISVSNAIWQRAFLR